MTPERWAEVERLFLEASMRPVGERSAFLTEACAGDAALQAEVQSLLDEATSPALERAPLAAMAAAIGNTSPHVTRGALIGVYRLQELIGAGGMGEVYRAHDTRLGRDVAIKILPPLFTGDGARQRRFEREAHVLASLNHPNIAAIYGFEERPATESEPGLQALVLELVEGETLAARLERSPMTIADALTVARQIADALEAAHDKGIVHRDLKPANVVIAHDGIVKVLDFGLAKPALAAATESPLTQQPVVGSGDGTILGTAAYMSPEQARGLPVDQRTDIWAFGSVLYEMLARRQAFGGQTASDSIAAILERDADWSALPPATPVHVTRLLRRCLEKDPKRRLHHIADARIEIDDALGGEAVTSGPVAGGDRRTGRLPWLLATLLLLAATVAIGIALRAPRVPESPARVSRTVLAVPGAAPLALGDDRSLAITPDGTRIVYIGSDARQLFVRRLDQLESTPIVTTAAPLNWVFVSPDGQRVGFIEGAILKTVPIDGGPVVALVSQTTAGGATWAADDTIIFGSDEGANLQRIPSSGGVPTPLTHPDVDRGERRHAWPETLPGGRAVLYTIFATTGGLDAAQVAVLDLVTGVSRVLVNRARHAHYLPSGHLVFVSGTALRAVPFDLERLEAGPTPVTVVPRLVTHRQGAGEFVVAADGTLFYIDAPAGAIAPLRSLLWIDRQGREEPVLVPRRSYTHLRVSPDERHVALTADDDIFVLDLARRTLDQRTFESVDELFPVWTSDSRRLLYTIAGRNGMLVQHPADGSGPGEALGPVPAARATSNDGAWIPSSVTSDGRHVIFSLGPRDLLMLSLDGSRRLDVLLQTPSNERRGVVSPDRRWLVYESDSSGPFEIYVRPFPHVQAGQQHLISLAGGQNARWTRKGRELVYEAPDGTLMAVAVDSTGSAWNAGTAAPAFAGLKARIWDVSADGRRALVARETPGEDTTAPEIVMVTNWVDELKRLVPTR